MSLKNAGYENTNLSRREAAKAMEDGAVFYCEGKTLWYDFEYSELGESPYRHRSGQSSFSDPIHAAWEQMTTWKKQVDWKEEVSPENPVWCRCSQGGGPAYVRIVGKHYSVWEDVEIFTDSRCYNYKSEQLTPVSDELAAMLEADCCE